MTYASATAEGRKVPNRGLITASIMLAAVLQSLDTTIANVALPHMQGSLQASQDQIVWVLTSYIVAAAIITPVTPWLAGRFGRKLVFLVSVAGFTAASALCGASQNLIEIVLFRLLQGIFGAALIPLSQSIMLDINPKERQGQAMATYATAIVLGPVIGPALGGWLTDNYSWRWVFYLNLPAGILAFMGIWTFLHEETRAPRQRFDFFGFSCLSLAIGGLQLMLDRGSGRGWFESTEIWAEFAVAITAAYLFTVHTLTAEHPFFDPALAKDRNFVAANIGAFFIMSVLFGVLALLPPMLENLFNYPVVTTGLVTMPRGVGMFVTMFMLGQAMKYVDSRILVGAGLVISVGALMVMTQFSLAMDANLVIWSGFAQGVATGLIFVPISTICFATLPGRLRTEGSAVYSLVRNIGSAVGISIIQAQLISNTQKVHSTLVEHLRPDNPMIGALHFPFSLSSPLGLAALNGEVTRQAAMVAYITDFRLMTFVTLAVFPVLLLLRKPKATPNDPVPIVE